MFRCRVILLDDTHIERDLEKNAVGQVLFDYVCDHLNLLERGYFGLAAWDSSNNRVWLDFSREVHKQIINHDATFTFNIKFYPPDPSLLAEDLTRYLLCLQVRTDIMTNRLPCPLDMLTVLGSYIVQSEFGDYDPDVHGPGYLSTIALAPNQTPELEESVTELHRTYNSMTPAQADENFLQNAMMLPFYGVDQHPAKDVNGADVMLGVSADGIVVYEGKTQTQSFPWPRVLKISYIRNKFQLRIRHTQDATESTFNYILSSYRASKRLWKVAVENHAFFRNHRQDKYEGLVQLGSRFRFRRNTHTETLETSSNIKRPGPPIAHCAIKKKAKESMLQGLRSPTRMEVDDWFHVFKFDRSRPTSVPDTTYTYQENLVSTEVDRKTRRHRHRDIKTGTLEEEEEDEVPEEEQEWFQLLGSRSFPKQVSLTSDTEKLERALPKYWKHNSEDWMDLLYPKISETSLWEQEAAPLFPQAGEQEEEYEKQQWEERTSEESIKIVKIRKDVQFVNEGREGLQTFIEEKLVEEGDGDRLQKVVITKQRTQDEDMFEEHTEGDFVEKMIRRVKIVEEIQEVVIEEGQKSSKENIKGLEKRLLEVESIEQRLQDVEDLKVRLQEVEMLEQKLQEQEEQLRDEYDVWYILLDRRSLVSAADLIEMAKRKETIKLLEEEPLQKVSPIHVRDVWHILLELLPRSQWATHLPRAPSVEEIVKAPVAAEERRWEEEMRLQEEKRRSSQMRITTQYSFPEGREEQPETDERDDWFYLLDASPKESMFGRTLEVYEETTKEKVRLVEEQRSFIKIEMPFEMVSRLPDELQESDRWFLLFDQIPFEKRSIPSGKDIHQNRRMKIEEVWRVKEEEKKRQQEQKMLLDETVPPREVKAMLPEHSAEELEVSESWFAEERRLKELQEKRIREEERRKCEAEEKRKREAEEKRVRITMQREVPEIEEGEDWFILFQTPFIMKVAEKADEEQLRKLEEWKKRVKVENRRKGAVIQEKRAASRDIMDDWFILLDTSLKDLDLRPPPSLPSPVISPVVVPKSRPVPKPLLEPKIRPEPKPRPEPRPRPVLPADQPLTSTPTAQPVPIPRPTYLDKSLNRLDITQESEDESVSVLIRKRMMKRMEGESIYVRHSLLMLEDLDVTQEVVLKHHASVRELKRIFMEDVPVSGPTEWDKRLSTHSTGHIPQVTDGQYIITMDTVGTESIIIRKVEEDEISAM
ncbi:protein 4.1b isoform X3 [Pygocentrus nattereri]|uniref:protein 4.1b isoform X3 n=1 Tax=Pygocentrus nattereri TaxID=42514 RepID=UPI001890D968|nr:protein 4.1b isoform X3 [Pygocentrus nattereri]